MVAFLRELRTQTEEFWAQDFTIRDQDVEALYAKMLEDGQSRSLPELVKALMGRRLSREKEVVSRESERGELYRPADKYNVGQAVVFPVFDFAIGTVVGLRPGSNPKYGLFSVIQVEMEGNGGVREFASEYAPAHKLSREQQETGQAEDLSREDLYRRFGHYVEPALQQSLLESDEFSSFEDKWFLRGLLPDIHVGHLNIAEAMVYESGHPMSTEELIPELDLGMGSPGEAQIFALSRALEEDGRFDDVSTSGSALWYLYALFPEAVAAIPDGLVVDFPARKGAPLHRESLEFVEELADENDRIGKAEDDVRSAQIGDSVTFPLTYPHSSAGTVPLTAQIAPLFPRSQNPRMRIAFVDARTREQMPGWVVRDGGYAWGLHDWYRQNQIPVGGYVELTRTDDPFVTKVDFARRSRRGQWVKVATLSEDGLTFQMGRVSVTARHDRHLLLQVQQTGEEDALRQIARKPGASLFHVLLDIFPELSKLSGQGLVHAKTLYSAVNVLYRCGAVPIYAELARRACFDPMGDGNWVLDPDLGGETYETVDEMMTRPRSNRLVLCQASIDG